MAHFDIMLESVKQAGRIALQHQRQHGAVATSLKADGSVLTQVDQEVEQLLVERFTAAFPATNIVTEESLHPFDLAAKWSVVIDPIDGTDNFSQGIPMWAISVGLLDRDLRPVAGVVYAPALDWLLHADLDGKVYLNEAPIVSPESVEDLTRLSGILMSSRMHQQLDLRSFPGKARAFGSASIHLASVPVYPGVIAALQDDKAFAWDIAAAHAVCLAAGCTVQYIDGSEVDYRALRDNQWRLKSFLCAAKPGAFDRLRPHVRLLGPEES